MFAPARKAGNQISRGLLKRTVRLPSNRQDGTRAAGNDLVRHAWAGMRCRIYVASCGADAQHDQVSIAFLRDLDDPLGRFSELHCNFRKKWKIRILWNRFIKLVDHFRDRHFKSPAFLVWIRVRHHAR